MFNKDLFLSLCEKYKVELSKSATYPTIKDGKKNMKLDRENLKSDKAKNFSETLDKNNTSLNSFIQLFNLWSEMTSEERGECIDNLLWKSSNSKIKK